MPAVVVANWLDINDISAGTQTNDIKVTLDSEQVVLGAGTSNIGDVDIASIASMAWPFTGDVPITLDSEQVVLAAGTNNIGDVDIASIASMAWPFTGDVPITLDSEQVDISDRAARLLGVVYGSQGQQLTQTATNYNLQIELATGGTLYDARQIRALTSSDVVDVADREARDLGKVDIAGFDVALPAGTNIIGKAKLVDRNGYALDVADDTALPANYSIVLIGGHDAEDIARTPTITVDPGDGKHRIAVDGKFSLSPPAPPSTATPRTISADNPLDVANTHTTDYTIPSGVTFHVTQITFGAEGDPNEKGSKATVSYVDSSDVEHVIERLYFTGFTAQVFPDTSQARDGTSMTGDGVNTKIRVKRDRLGGAALEVDCVVRGYEQ
jgi:hypothetical protein